jgi:formimidoylglutamase
MEKKKLGKSPANSFMVLGFPDDLGVRNVNGRPGAKEGPHAFIETFLKLNGRYAIHKKMMSPVMVTMGASLEANYIEAASEVARVRSEMLSSADCLIVVGGGHDYAYPWIRGISQSIKKGKRVGCLNIDAHFDLRGYDPVMTSGSPFRRILDEKLLDPKRLVEFGIQEHCNSAELWEYAHQAKIKVVPFEKLRNGRAVAEFKKALTALRAQCDEVLISVDLDAMSFAFCPGVSAPQGEGFTGSELYQMMEIAGADKKVTSLGWFELSPALDQHNYTSRLAAQASWHFLARKLQC